MSRIYINAGLSTSERARLVSALADHELVWAQPVENVLAKGKPDSALASAEIAFGQPDPDAVLSSPSLRFVQLTSAGWTRYDRADLAATLRTRGTILCNASSVYAAAVAEHTIATMLALLRCLPEAIDAQRGQHEWRFAELRAGSRTLAAVGVAFLGLVLMLQPWGASLAGNEVVGAALGAGSAVFYASNVMVNKRLVKAFSGAELMFFHGLVATPLLFALVPLDQYALVSHDALWVVMGGALGPGALGGLLFVWGLRRIPASQASVLTLLEPFVAVVLAAAVLDQRVGALALAGGALILVGAVLVVTGRQDGVQSPP